MRKEKKYHYIYKTTCLITDRFYIGLHSTDNLDDNYIGSGKYLWHSIKKYGKENHIKEILEYCKDRKELKQREEEIVNKELLGEELCMNLALGGTGGILNEEHREKLYKGASDSLKNRWNNEKDREIFLNNISETMKKNHREGKIKYDNFRGKKHSEETKEKMSESMKGKGIGKTNSQYGTMWITNDIENKKIKKDDIIPSGWRKGRISKK